MTTFLSERAYPMTKQSECEAVIRAELIRADVTRFSFEQGKKHSRVVYWHKGRVKMYFYSKTPSDARMLRNLRADIRRQLRTSVPSY
jgi:hypothetical protein